MGWLEEVIETREAVAGIARQVQITETGCPFYNRCPLALRGICDERSAPAREVVVGHRIACHRDSVELA